MSLRTTFLLTMGLTLPLHSQAAVVINEVLYEVPGTDVGEFVELCNNGAEEADISGWSVVLVDGAKGVSYQTISIPQGTKVPPKGYYTIGNAATFARYEMGKPDLDYPLDDGIQNGSQNGEGGPDAMVLRDAGGERRDSLTYEADNRFFTGPDTADALAEGGTGRVVSRRPDSKKFYSIGRLPDGVDTDANLRDFANIFATPGMPNKSTVELPYKDSFEDAASSEWALVFQANLGLLDPLGKGKPGKPSPDGGNCVEIFDPTGGGNGLYLPGAWDQMNYEGYIWFPAAAEEAWSVGVGIGTRSEGAWFSLTPGESIENGFYLEYENGPLAPELLGLRKSTPVDKTPLLRLLAVDSTRAINSGDVSGALISALASNSDDIAPGDWNQFRLIFDRPGNRLAAFINGKSLYDGPFPKGNYNKSGGVSMGWREFQDGRPAPSQASWFDGVILDTNLGPEPSLKPKPAGT